MPPIAIDDAVTAAIADGAWFVFSLSGGKDSSAAAFAANMYLDAARHPRSRRLAIHADLGRAEWRSTPQQVEASAARLGLPLLVVRRHAGDMVARWEQRFANGCARFAALSTYHLIGPWSQANKRFCTSELKAQVIGPELARRFRGQTIVSVIGIRRAESAARKLTPVSAVDTRFAKPGKATGTTMLNWYPAVDWSTAQVFACHDRHALPLHEAYTRYGSTRLSCAFCVLGSAHDLAAATDAASNRSLYCHLVDMEARSTFSFQPARWLADIAPALLSGTLRAAITQAKLEAFERRRLEASMPAALRFAKGWPPRAPSLAEAQAITAARAPLLRRHGLDNRYPDAGAVVRRFDELLAMQAAKQR